MWNFPDLTGLFWLAMFGLFCAVIGGVGIVGFVIWFCIHHVRIV